MSSSIINRSGTGPAVATSDRGVSAPYGEGRGRGRTFWVLAAFVVVGFAISVAVSMFAGSTPYGVFFVALALIAAVPGIALTIQAIPQGIHLAREFAKTRRWWHLPWFCIFFSMLVWRIRDVGAAAQNPLDGYAMLRVIPEGFVSVALIIRLILKKPNWLGALFRGIPGAMAIYCLICLATTPVSVNAAWTAYKSLEFLADVSLMASIIASAEGFITYESWINWTLIFYGVSLLGVWSNLPIWPTEAMDGGRLTGVIPVEASNSVGSSGAVLSIIAICRLMPVFGKAKNRAWYLLLLAFGMVSMVLSKTRSAEGAFAAAVLMLVVLTPVMRKIAIWATLAATPLIALAVYVNDRLPAIAWDFVLSIAQRDQSDAAIGSLSGRTAWWEYGIEQLSHHPWTGLGAYAAGRFAVLGKLGVGSAAMMHSDWIEVLIGTSFWGIIPFAGALLAAWWYLFRCVRSRQYEPEQRQLAVELLGLLGMLTLHSFFNDELSWHCPLLYFSILGYAEYLRTYPKRALSPALNEARRPAPLYRETLTEAVPQHDFRNLTNQN
jgi:O-antigen ligase